MILSNENPRQLRDRENIMRPTCVSDRVSNKKATHNLTRKWLFIRLPLLDLN